MVRLLALLCGLVGPAVAAPVPKALKKKAPDMTGTTWVSDENEAKLGVIEYTFQDGGKLSWKTQGQNTVYTRGSWKQDGETLWWEVNDRYVDYNVTFADGVFDGAALNKTKLKWTIKLKPREEK